MTTTLLAGYFHVCIVVFTDIPVDVDKQQSAIYSSSSQTVLEALKQDPFRLYGGGKEYGL